MAECLADEAEIWALITAFSCPSPQMIGHISGSSSMCSSPCLFSCSRCWFQTAYNAPLAHFNLQSESARPNHFQRRSHPSRHSSMTFHLMSPSVHFWGKWRVFISGREGERETGVASAVSIKKTCYTSFLRNCFTWLSASHLERKKKNKKNPTLGWIFTLLTLHITNPIQKATKVKKKKKRRGLEIEFKGWFHSCGLYALPHLMISSPLHLLLIYFLQYQSWKRIGSLRPSALRFNKSEGHAVFPALFAGRF